MTKYQKPDVITKHVFNPLVAGLTRLGLRIKGSAVLSVRGRKSGEWRSTPVNPLEFEGHRYLVAPRGETQWVRNIRVSHEGQLRWGRTVSRIRVQELPDSEKVPVLRAYLKNWRWEVGQFFDVKDANPPDEDLVRIAPDHPIFHIAD